MSTLLSHCNPSGTLRRTAGACFAETPQGMLPGLALYLQASKIWLIIELRLHYTLHDHGQADSNTVYRLPSMQPKTFFVE